MIDDDADRNKLDVFSSLFSCGGGSPTPGICFQHLVALHDVLSYLRDGHIALSHHVHFAPQIRVRQSITRRL